MVAKGRSAAGVRAPSAKLTVDNVLTIRRLVSDGMFQEMVAKLFRVTNSTVSMIHTGKRWRHVVG